MGREKNNSINRRKFLKSMGSAGGFYGVSGTNFAQVAAATPRDSGIDLDEVLSGFRERIFEDIRREISNLSLNQLQQLISQFSTSVADTVADTIEDLQWIEERAGWLQNSLQDAKSRWQEDQDEEEDEEEEENSAEEENSNEEENSDDTSGYVASAGAPNARYNSSYVGQSTTRASLSGAGFGGDLKEKLKDSMPDVEKFKDKHEDVEEYFGGAYDEFKDRFGDIPTPDEVVDWVESVWDSIAGWFLELVPDFDLSGDLDDLFPLSTTIDFSSFDFGDFFEEDLSTKINIPVSFPDELSSASSQPRFSSAAGVSSGPVGAGVGSDVPPSDAVLEEFFPIELKDCPPKGKTAYGIPIEFDLASAIGDGGIPGPCNDLAANVWLGTDFTTPCVYSAMDATAGCSLSPRGVVNYVETYEEELEAFSDEFSDGLAELIRTVNEQGFEKFQTAIDIDVAIDQLDEIEAYVDDVDHAVSELPVDPLNISGTTARLLEDDTRSFVEDEIGHAPASVGAFERLRLMLEDTREIVDEYEVTLPTEEIDDVAAAVEGTSVDVPAEELRALRADLDRKIEQNAREDGTIQIDVPRQIDEDADRLARELYAVARENDGSLPVENERIEALAEQFDDFSHIEVDLSDELEATFREIWNGVLGQLESYVNRYAELQIDATDKLPDIECKRHCKSSRGPSPTPLPAPSTDSIIDRLKRIFDEFREGLDDIGDFIGEIFPWPDEIPTPSKTVNEVLTAGILIVAALLLIPVIIAAIKAGGAAMVIVLLIAAIPIILGQFVNSIQRIM